MKKHLTIEQRREICSRYLKCGLTYADIAKEFGVATNTVWRICSAGSATRKLEGNLKKCPHCSAKLPAANNMAFCCYCGADISTPAQKAVKSLTRMLNDISVFYPAERRDFAVKTINDTIEILKGGN